VLRLPVYVWQLTRDYPGCEADDTRLPVCAVWFKTHDGVTWMGHIYSHPRAPVSTLGIGHLVRWYASLGLRFLPWCVPTAEDIPREADLAIQVLAGLELAGAPLQLAFDLEVEDTPNFWKGSPVQAEELIGRVRQRYPRAELTLVLYQDAEIGLNQIAPLFDGYSTMDYWTNYATEPEVQLLGSHQRLAGFGKPVVYGLPGDAPRSELAVALDWIRTQAGGRCVLWRRGIIPRENWDLVASFTD
jgi:hypothetical protein